MMMNKVKHAKHEAGQIIVVMAFLLIAMIAMLGLAIDGGGLMLLSRDTQNALDHSIVAATYARCSVDSTNAQIVSAGRDAAAQHGFEHGVDGVTVEVNTPPTSGTGAGDDEYVEVIITAPKDTYFIQIVYNDPLSVTTRGVGKCNPDVVTTHIKALSGLGECGFTVSTAGGAGGMNIYGGGIFSNDMINTNSHVYINPSPHTDASPELPAHTAETGGDITYVNSSASTQFGNPQPVVNPPLGTAVEFPLLYDIADYQPGGDIAVAAGANYHPFNESSITISGKPGDEPLSGLIYNTGDITVSLKDLPNGTYTATLVSLNGDITFKQGGGAGKRYVLTSFTETLGVGDYLLVFTMAGQNSPNCNADGVKFAGDDWISRGVVYIPYKALAWSMSNSYFEGALIAYALDIRGSQHDIHFQEEMIPPIPPDIQFSE